MKITLYYVKLKPYNYKDCDIVEISIKQKMIINPYPYTVYTNNLQKWFYYNNTYPFKF